MNPEQLVTTVRTRTAAFFASRPGAKRAAVASLILVGGATAAGGLVATTPQTPAEEPEERAWPVSVQHAAPATHSPVLSAFGRVESAAVTRLEARLAAPIAEVLVREGERVEAGQLLVRLDDAEARFDLVEREAEVTEARATLETTRNAAALTERTAEQQEALAAMADAKLERFESLFERGMVARDALDAVRREASLARIAVEQHRTELADFPHRIAQAEAGLRRAEVARDRAAVELERTRVVAPFPGPVATVEVARGDQVITGTPLLTLVDETSVELRVPVPADDAERLRGRLAEGRTATARVTLAGENIEVPLARLAGDQKDGSTVVDAFFRIDARYGGQVGRVVDVRLAFPAEEALVAVPVGALYENDRIYRVEDDRLVAMEAEVVGEADDAEGYRVLLRVPGIEEGDRIVTTQLPRAITGLRVKAVGGLEPGEQLAAQDAARPEPVAG